MIKNSIVFICLLASAFAFGAKKELVAFNALTVNSRIIVELIEDDSFYLETVKSKEFDESKLSLEYKGEHLHINYSGNLIKGLPIEFKIHCNNLKSVKANSGSEITMVKGFVVEGNRVKFSAFAGGKLTVYSNAKITDAEIKQGGIISIEGKTEQLIAKVVTGGLITTSFLSSDDVKAEVNLGGEIICTAKNSIDAKVTSGGTISYIGDPEVTEKVVLGGTIEKIKK